MEKEQLYKELVSLIAPRVIAENFELLQIVEKPTSITLYFEEKDQRIPEELKGKEAVQDGYLNKMELQTFPLKDKTVYIAVRRRRWKERGTPEQSYSNRYDLHFEGMKTTKEFGIFLKEELGFEPDEYNKFWQSITDQGSDPLSMVQERTE
jgi:hypothetical protein